MYMYIHLGVLVLFNINEQFSLRLMEKKKINIHSCSGTHCVTPLNMYKDTRDCE